MLNSVIDFLPGPLDVPPYMGFAPNDPEEKEILKEKLMIMTHFLD